MPLESQKPQTITVNAAYAAQIQISTSVSDGKLSSTVQLVMGGANVNEKGAWTAATSGGAATINLSSLPGDLKHLQPDIDAAFGAIVAVVDKVNAVRKLA
ncbi:MAG TPA: hypothetical protein VF624_15055 [Tepidisphaeraceae bacterium]|jgi:hypothetical protein